MRLWQKMMAVAVLIPFLGVSGYATYLWATYIDETTVSGSAQGFTIGTSKQQVLASVRHLTSYPHAVVYVSYGHRAGDNFTVDPVSADLDLLREHDQWRVLLDGEGEFFNSVRLSFRDGELVEIHRHRQRFELP